MQIHSVVLQNILSFLDRRDLYNCSLVNRKWRDFVNKRQDAWLLHILSILTNVIKCSDIKQTLSLVDQNKLMSSRFCCLQKLREDGDKKVKL